MLQTKEIAHEQPRLKIGRGRVEKRSSECAAYRISLYLIKNHRAGKDNRRFTT